MLDFEGNNVSSIDQLYYLKRCQRLTDVNLKNNPVAKEISYLSKIKDNVPNLQCLDDEIVFDAEKFFEEKARQARKQGLTALPEKKQVAL